MQRGPYCSNTLRMADTSRWHMEVCSRKMQVLLRNFFPGDRLEFQTIAAHNAHRFVVFMQFVGILLIFKSVAVMLIEDTSDATISTLTTGSKLPFRVEYGEKLDRYLYPIAIHCYLAVFAHISITIAIDSFYIVLVRHACGMFAIVG